MTDDQLCSPVQPLELTDPQLARLLARFCQRMQRWTSEHAHALTKAVNSEVDIAERQALKTGRNATCPSGSGVKFKKCCLPELSCPRSFH